MKAVRRSPLSDAFKRAMAGHYLFTYVKAIPKELHALLEAKLEEAKRLDAEIRKLKNAARDKDRAEDDERRKIVGRLVLAQMAEHPDGELALSVTRLLGEQLSRASERNLFPDLPSPAEPAGNGQNTIP